MIVVSHRGPYRFEANGDGSFSTAPVARAVSRARCGAARSRRASTARRGSRPRSPTTTGTRRESGALDDLGIDLRLIALEPELHALHYDVVSNGVLWFLFHELFDRDAPAALRPSASARPGTAYRDRERRVRGGDRRRGRDRRRRARERLPARRWSGAQLRELRPDLRIVHFTHTPFCGPDDMRVLPDYAAETICAGRWPPTRPASTARAGLARTSSRRATCSAAARRSRPTFAASLGPDVAALEDVAAERRSARGRRRARRHRRRPARDRAQRPHRAVEEHRARLSRLRPSARSPARAARPGGVRRDAVSVARRGFRSISRTRARSSRSSRA